MAGLGGHVILACRSLERADEAVQYIREIIGKDTPDFEPQLESMRLDLSDLNSVKEFADAFREKFDRLDILINNAAVTVRTYETTAQGYELMFGVNHLGHVYLTNLLLDLLIKSAPARIVIVASAAYKFEGDFNKINQPPSDGVSFSVPQSLRLYGLTKACNITFGLDLTKRLEDANIKGVTVNMVHPGAVNTDLQRNAPGWVKWIMGAITKLFFKSPERGAMSSIFAATSPTLQDVSGKFINEDQNIEELQPFILDETNRAFVWETSERLIKESMGEDALKPWGS